MAALIALARPLADYAFFQKLSERMEALKGSEKKRLERLRETVLRLTQEIDEAARARVQQTSAILQQMLNSPDPRPLVQQYLPLIDENFMAVLTANLEHAQKNGRPEVAQRLQQLGNTIIAALNDAAPPELRFINDLLRAESEEMALA